MLTLKVAVTHKDVDLKNPPTFVSQAEIRRANQLQEVQKMLKEAYDFDAPFVEMAKDFIKPKKKSFRWYEPPPKWFLRRGKG